MGIPITSPLFASQGDDAVRAIPPFLHPNVLEPVTTDATGNTRQHVEAMDSSSDQSPRISTPVICLLAVVVILGFAVLFWLIKCLRSARQQHEEEGSSNVEKGDMSLNNKVKIGWRKLQCRRKRQSTWFDVATGQHFAEVLPPSSTGSFTTDLSTEHLLRDGGRRGSTVLFAGGSVAPTTTSLFVDDSSRCSVSEAKAPRLQVDDIGHAASEKTTPIISPLSVYSQNSLSHGLCKPISALRLKPRALYSQHPTWIPSHPHASGDSFEVSTSPRPVKAQKETQSSVALDPSLDPSVDRRIDSTVHQHDEGSNHVARSTRTVDAITSWHFPSPSVTACIIRNSIYHYQSPPSKSRSKPPATADSDSLAFEYDDSNVTEVQRDVESRNNNDVSTTWTGACAEVTTSCIVPAGLKTAALSSRRNAPRIRRRTSHNFLLMDGSTATGSSDGNTPEVAQFLQEPERDMSLIRTNPGGLTFSVERAHSGHLSQDVVGKDTLQNVSTTDYARLGVPHNRDPQQCLRLPSSLEALYVNPQRQTTPLHAASLREDVQGPLLLPSTTSSNIRPTAARVPVPTAYLPEHGSSKDLHGLMKAMGLH